MKDSEFLEEVQARETLKLMGYVKVECKTCNGKGILLFEGKQFDGLVCKNCDGNKYSWELREQ